MCTPAPGGFDPREGPGLLARLHRRKHVVFSAARSNPSRGPIEDSHVNDFVDRGADSAASERDKNVHANFRVAKLIIRSGMKLPGSKLTAIERIPASGGESHNKWRCQCDCGKETIVRSSYLISGKTTSCGCKRGDARRDRARLIMKKKETRGRKKLPPAERRVLISARISPDVHATLMRLLDASGEIRPMPLGHILDALIRSASR